MGASYETVKCGGCGAPLDSFNEYANRGFCPYCGALVRKADGMDEVERALRRAYDYRDKLGEMDKARVAAREFADLHPGDFRAWKMDFEFNANREIGAAYDPRPIAVERMCLTAEDAIDRQYLKTVAAELTADRGKLEARVTELGVEANEIERFRTKSGKGDWKHATEEDLARIEREISEIEARIRDLSLVSVTSVASYVKGMAFICGMLLTIAMVSDGCSKGDFASAFNGVVLGPLGGLLFGVPAGAIAGFVIARIVMWAKALSSERATAQERARLDERIAARQGILVELGRASEAGELKERADCLMRSIVLIDDLTDLISRTI